MVEGATALTHLAVSYSQPLAEREREGDSTACLLELYRSSRGQAHKQGGV